MKQLIITTLFLIFSSTLFPQSNDPLYNSNLAIAEKLFNQDIITYLLSKTQLNDMQKQALIVAEYYKFSKQDISYQEMHAVLKAYYGQDQWNSDEQVETHFAILIKQAEDLMRQKDLSYLADIKKLKQ